MFQYEQEMYNFYKSKDYTNVTDWKELFSSHIDYINARNNRNHYFHKEAMQIFKNRRKAGIISVPKKVNYENEGFIDIRREDFNNLAYENRHYEQF